MIITLIVLVIGYILYGRYVARIYDLDPNRETPAHTKKDGVDYVPTKAPVFSVVLQPSHPLGPVLWEYTASLGPGTVCDKLVVPFQLPQLFKAYLPD